MISKIKKSIFLITFNSFLLLLLIITIQNSSKKSKVNFFSNETIELPISFIVGIGLISGSVLGSFIAIDFGNKKE